MEGLAMIIFFVFYGAFMLGWLGLMVYVMVLMIKLMRRGITALDIFLAEKASAKNEAL